MAALSMWKPFVSAAYVGSPTCTIALAPEYRNTVPPLLPLAVLAPRRAQPRSDTFLVPAVTITWLAVEIVAQGSSTVAFAVAIVRFDPIDCVPVKFRASHVPP